MSFGGSVSAMLTSLKSNKVRTREPRQSEHFKHVEGVPIGKPLKFNGSISEDELDTMRRQLKKKRKKEITVTYILYSAVIITAVVTIIFFMG